MKLTVLALATAAVAATFAFSPVSADAHSRYYFGVNFGGPAFYPGPAPVAYYPPAPVVVARPVYPYPYFRPYPVYGGPSFSFGYVHH